MDASLSPIDPTKLNDSHRFHKLLHTNRYGKRGRQRHQQYESALKIVHQLHTNGFKAYFAGGSVRDMLSDRLPPDYDIVTNAPADLVPKLFNKKRVNAAAVGKAFPISIIDGIEVASGRAGIPFNGINVDKPRSPTSLQTAHNSFQTNHSKQIADNFPACDLAHRDLTINSMAYDPISHQLIDPFAGQRDLKNKTIRFTGNPDHRIIEDPLRMVRACRFLAAIEGAFEPSTLQAIRSNIFTFTKHTASERIRTEILKAMELRHPSLFFKALHTAGLLGLIFPSLSRCVDLDGGPHHGESVFEHCMLTGDALSPKMPLLRLAGYLHDTGKYDAAVMTEDTLSFPGHETMGDQAVKDLEILRFSTREIKYIDAVIKTHMRPLTPDSTPKAVRRLLAFLKKHEVTWQEFMRIRIADKSANLAKSPYTLSDIKLRVEKIKKEIEGCKEKTFSLKDLAIDGRDIMEILDISQSKKIGMIMNALFEVVLDTPEMNTHSILTSYLQKKYQTDVSKKRHRSRSGER